MLVYRIHATKQTLNRCSSIIILLMWQLTKLNEYLTSWHETDVVNKHLDYLQHFGIMTTFCRHSLVLYLRERRMKENLINEW
jgi:hypothetical protein